MCTFHDQWLQPKCTQLVHMSRHTELCMYTGSLVPRPFCIKCVGGEKGLVPTVLLMSHFASSTSPYWSHNSHGNLSAGILLAQYFLLLNGTTKYVLHWRNGAADYSMIFIHCYYVIDAHDYSMRYELMVVSIHTALKVSWWDISTAEGFVGYNTDEDLCCRIILPIDLQCNVNAHYHQFIHHFMVYLWFLYASMFHICMYETQDYLPYWRCDCKYKPHNN